MDAFRGTLLQDWEELPPCFITSAVKGQGREELLTYLQEVIAHWKPAPPTRQSTG